MLKNMLSIVGFFFFQLKNVLYQRLREVAKSSVPYQHLCTKPCFAHVWSGTRDPSLGWSGILDRKMSSSNLNRSWSFSITRNFLGRQLKSLAPSVLKLCSCSVCIAFLLFWTIWGILHFLPILAFYRATSTPQFGAYPSKIFHMYITW